MEVPRDTRQNNEDSGTRDLYAALEAAAQFFRRQLAASDKARAYVEKREIDPGIVERFGIGYAPDGFNGLRDALGTDERRMHLLERAGLFSRNEKGRSEEHTSELQSLMRISYAVFCLKKKKKQMATDRQQTM